MHSTGSWHLLKQELNLIKEDILSTAVISKQSSCPVLKKANLQILFHPNNLCFPLWMAEITPTLLIISLKLSEVLFNNSDNPPSTTQAEIRGPDCSHWHPGGLCKWMLWGNPNSALVSCSVLCKTPLQKIPLRSHGEQIYGFASALEGSLLPELNAKVEAR